MKWANPVPMAKAIFQREAGPMNWRNPVQVIALVGWKMFRAGSLAAVLTARMAVRTARFLHAIPTALMIFFAGTAVTIWHFAARPFPALETNPLLDLLEYHNPDFYSAVLIWYYVSPLVAVMITGSILQSIWKVWIERRRRDCMPFGALPEWPISPEQKAPGIVIGEVHHPVQPKEIFNPDWLSIPERGLYADVAIFGAVGSGKTSACMHPFARQLLGWQAHDPEKRAAALVLEVKGDFCHDIRQILIEMGRGEDYIELGMEGEWQWNPLSAKWLDSYSLAYTVASLLNQLFGKGKEPFWQQAYTNLVRWIIELHRVLPQEWVTLQHVYRCAIDPDLFAAKIEQAEQFAASLNKGHVFIPSKAWKAKMTALGEWNWKDTPGGEETQDAYSLEMERKLKELKIPYRIVWEPGSGDDIRERVLAVKRWYENDWQKLDNKIKSSIVEGVSVFLSMFDMPDVARVFCPPAPKVPDDPRASRSGQKPRRTRKTHRRSSPGPILETTAA